MGFIAGFHPSARLVPRLPRRGDAGRPGADPDVSAARADVAEAQGCRFRRYIVSSITLIPRAHILSNRE